MDQREVWDNIAEDWRKFRETPPKEVADFLASKKGLILDLGCGAGRNFVTTKGKIIGSDFSESMLRFADSNAKKSNLPIPLVVSDATDLPFADNSFDSVVCAAALHCIKFNKHKHVLKEIKRVAKDGATVLITVWNKDQPRFAGSKKEGFVPWKSGDAVYQRYYYLYSSDELKAAIKKYFSNVMVFGSSDKAFGKYSKNIIAVSNVRKYGFYKGSKQQKYLNLLSNLFS